MPRDALTSPVAAIAVLALAVLVGRALAAAPASAAQAPTPASAAPAVPPAGALRPARPASAAQAAFRLCDSRAFVALSVARAYLLEGRNREQARALVRDNPWGSSMVDELLRRADAGTLRHHAEFAGDVLVQCAIAEAIPLGVTKPAAQLCLARADIAQQLHAARSRGVARQVAVERVTRTLTPPELYPPGLVPVVAAAVYQPTALPELRRLSGQVVWSCIREQSRPAAAASR